MKFNFFLFFSHSIVFPLFSQDFPIQATTQHAGGTYSIYRNAFTDNVTISTMRKSVIWVEGFEIITPISISQNYGILNSIEPNTFGPSLASQIHSAGYDIVILNFNNASDQIQRNARVLKDLIVAINAGKTNSDPLVIIGYSMGGLVARYALVDMENQNIDHKTRLYISYDAPHKGAHVPASVQSLALTFNSTTWRTLFPKLATLLDRFNSPAAQQMLKYRVTSPTVSQTFPVSPSHSAFLNELNSLNTNGGFPRNCQSVALSLGNWSGIPQRANFDADGDGKNDYQYSGFPAVYINFPQDSYSGPQSIWNLNLCQAVGAFSFQSFLSTASAVSYPYYASRPNYLSLGNFDYVTYWYRNSTGTALLPAGAWSTINNYANNAEAIDFAPGSLSDTYDQVVTTLNSQIDCSFAYYKNSTFVPTVSALAFNTNDLFYKIGDDVSRLAKTPFADIFASCDDNRSHSDVSTIATNPRVVQWVMSKINNQATQQCYCNSSAVITGASPFCSSGTFSLQNLIPNTPVSWFSSNPSGLSINSSTGAAMRLNNFNGPATITTTIGGACGSINVTKSIIVGTGVADPLIEQKIIVCPTPYAYSIMGNVTQSPDITATYKWYIGTAARTNFVLKATTTSNSATVPGDAIDNLYHTLRIDIVNSCGAVSTALPEGRFLATCGNGGQLRVFPNPSSNQLSLQFVSSDAELSATDDESIELRDQMDFEATLFSPIGILVKSGRSVQGNLTFDTSGLLEGLYVLWVNKNGEIITKQIWVKH